MTVGDREPGSEIAEAEEMQKLPSLARHLPRILMPLSGMIDSYAQREDVARNRRLMEFFRFVKDTYSDEGYAAIQRTHLSSKNIGYVLASDFRSVDQKYLDFPFWAHSKFNIAIRLKLEKCSGGSILDLGAGPAHFGVVANNFGCRYEGLEVPAVPWTPHTERHLYDDLSEFFKIARMTHIIRPYKPIPVQNRFHLVTCLMGNFCSYRAARGEARKPWGWAEWVFLLDNLVTDVTMPEHNMYFHISRDYLPADVMGNLRKFAKTFDEASCVFTFDESLDLDELRRSVRANP